MGLLVYVHCGSEDALVFAARLHAGDIRKDTAILNWLTFWARRASPSSRARPGAIAALLQEEPESKGRSSLVQLAHDLVDPQNRAGAPSHSLSVPCSDGRLTTVYWLRRRLASVTLMSVWCSPPNRNR
jgi:hypothetical protein